MVELSSLHVMMTGDSKGLVSSTNVALAGFAKLTPAVSKAQAALQQAATSNAKIAGAFRNVATASKLAAASTTAYSATLKSFGAAAKTGVSAQTSLNAALKTSSSAFTTAGTQASTMSTQIRTSRFHTANLSAQFNDIGVMFASGQSPFTLAIQQGTQITQVLQTMGGTAKQQLGALRDAFKAIISPTALVVIGVIAGGVALGRWAFLAGDAKDETEDLKKASDDLGAAMSTLDGTVDILEADIEELRDRFGEAALAARELARQIAFGEADELRREMAKTNDVVREATEALGEFGIESDAVANTMISFPTVPRGVIKDFRDLGLTAPEMTLLAGALKAVRDASADQEQAAVLGMVGTLNKLGLTIADLPDKVQGPITEYLRQINRLREAQAILDRSLNIPSVSGSKGDKGSAEQAARDLERFEEANKRAEEQILIELERINEFNDTKLEIEEQFHQDRNAIIEEARNRDLITEEEANASSEDENERHQQAMADIDAAVNATRLKAVAGVMGGIADLLAQGGEKALQIARVFGAAQALINAWIAFSLVLADKTLLWWERIPLALGVLAAGIGAVNAIKSVGKGGTGMTSSSAGNNAPTNAGQVEQQETTQTTNVNIALRGQTFDRGAVIGLIEQINLAVGDGARIRSV